MRQMENDRRILESNLQKQLLEHQIIVQQMAANQNTKWALIGGVAVGALTGGLGMLAGMAIAGGGGGVAALATLPAAQMAGELGKRALMGVTQGALQLGASVLTEAGPSLAAQAIGAAIDSGVV